jgi:hypothetical protein
MDLILITNNVSHASIAQEAGIEYIMVDLEINGKERRQGHLNTVISRHTMEDARRVRNILDRSRLLVRINPIFHGSQDEIEACIGINTDTIMLPMFTSGKEVDRFVNLVAGRAKTCLLLETPQAFVRIDEIIQCRGIDVIHIGLNDLHLGFGLDFMFELLAHGQVSYLADRFNANGIKFGFGGIARMNTGMLRAELILSEHVRLNSQQVILSRDFKELFDATECEARSAFRTEVDLLRKERDRLTRCTAAELERNSNEARHAVKSIVDRIALRAHSR